MKHISIHRKMDTIPSSSSASKFTARGPFYLIFPSDFLSALPSFTVCTCKKYEIGKTKKKKNK